MKKLTFALLMLLFSIAMVWGQTPILSENIQSWTNRISYGSYTQIIPVGEGTGTVSMTACIVANAAAATGTCSIGRVQMQASTGILELPALPSVGRVEFHIAAGAAGRTVALQSYNGSTWDAITSFSGIGTTGATFYHDVNNLNAATLRLATPSAAIYVHDIIITNYGSSTPTLAVLSTAVISSITSTSAISGGTIISDGGSSVTARGVCWNTSANPTIANNITTDGTGTGSFVSSLTNLTADTQYYFRAYATNSQGTAYGEEYSFSTSGNSPPSAPVAISASSLGINSFVANWNASAGATSYRLDVSTASNFATLLSNYNNLTVNSLSQAVSGLSANTSYYYRVRAFNANGTSLSSNTISTSTLVSDGFGGYYSSVLGLSGTTLKTELHNLIDNNTYANYDGAKTFLFQDLDNVNSVVRCVYTGQDYTINSSYNGSSSPNTEHTYAQSWFGTAEASIKKADVHHLFITNSSVNSSRSNLPFDVVTNVDNTYSYANGYISKRGDNSDGSTVFEPADQHKGNLARALLYFNVRYNMTLSQGGVDMLETLLTWHNADPVDAAELTRNTAVYGHQGNRNPFVDHPEFVASIWGGSTATTVVQFSPASALLSETAGSVTLNVQILNPSATVATTAQIAISSGSASDVGNFTTRSITFPANSSANQSISVTITNDSILEGTEAVIFSLINVSGGNSAAVGNYSSFNLEIEDNDIPTPVATAATATSYTGFTANWNAASGISDYVFDLSTSADFSSFVEGFENYIVSATSLAISGLNPGTTYYYRVRAFFNESTGLSSGTITASTLAIPAPVAIAASGIGFTGFTANWNAVPGFADYQFDLSVSPTFSTFVGVYQNYPLSSTSLTLADLSGGTTYYYRVKTMLGLSASVYSNVIITTTNTITYLDAPLATEATAVSHEGFTARWNAVTGADSYLLNVFSGSSATIADLLISEYVEGSSNNKYIEIFNGTGAEVDLSDYQIRLYSNGASSATSFTTLAGLLPNGACAVFKNSASVLTLPEGVTATTCAAVNFNGDDAVALYKLSASAFVDIFGNIGVDPGDFWGITPLVTKDKTLRRKSTVLAGVTVDPANDLGFPSLESEWDSFAIDSADDLGSHSVGASSPVAGYQDLAVNTNLARVSGLSPETAYSYRVKAVNIGDTSDASNTIQVSTTASIAGTSANTCIGGAASTIIIPAISGYANVNASLDPLTSSSDDFAVTVSNLPTGLRYSFTCANNSAFNGSYTLQHEGLGFVPGSVIYRLDGTEYSASGFVSTLNQTSLSLAGLSRNRGILQIDLLPGVLSLNQPVLSIAVNGDSLELSWEEISGATSYRVEASDNPYSGFELLVTTSNLSYTHSGGSKRFYRVTAIN